MAFVDMRMPPGIKVIVSAQQSHARATGIVERTTLSELVDDALAMNAASTERHVITVVRDYAETGEVEVDRHKLLQILINLISNTRHALRDCAGDRRLVLRTRAVEGGRVAIEVEDNGVGIAPENIDKIFNHGFTTKPEGHGFGLHSSGCAAIELGGTLRGRSEGPGRGATFVLELPAVRRTSVYSAAA